jgi:hypothetical protein
MPLKKIHQAIFYVNKIFIYILKTLSEVLELRVTETEGQRSQRNHYKYEQLHDLQSRLMLVAGKAEKGKDDVDRFMLVCVISLGYKNYSEFTEIFDIEFSHFSGFFYQPR